MNLVPISQRLSGAIIAASGANTPERLKGLLWDVIFAEAGTSANGDIRYPPALLSQPNVVEIFGSRPLMEYRLPEGMKVGDGERSHLRGDIQDNELDGNSDRRFQIGFTLNPRWDPDVGAQGAIVGQVRLFEHATEDIRMQMLECADQEAMRGNFELSMNARGRGKLASDGVIEAATLDVVRSMDVVNNGARGGQFLKCQEAKGNEESDMKRHLRIVATAIRGFDKALADKLLTLIAGDIANLEDIEKTHADVYAKAQEIWLKVEVGETPKPANPLDLKVVDDDKKDDKDIKSKSDDDDDDDDEGDDDKDDDDVKGKDDDDKVIGDPKTDDVALAAQESRKATKRMNRFLDKAEKREKSDELSACGTLLDKKLLMMEAMNIPKPLRDVVDSQFRQNGTVIAFQESVLNEQAGRIMAAHAEGQVKALGGFDNAEVFQEADLKSLQIGQSPTDKIKAAFVATLGQGMSKPVRLQRVYDPLSQSYRQIYQEAEGFGDAGKDYVPAVCREGKPSIKAAFYLWCRMAHPGVDPYRVLTMQESIDSTTFSVLLGETLNIRLATEWDMNEWNQYWPHLVGPHVEAAADFKTINITRIGGYGDLSDVNEGADYVNITSPSSEEASAFKVSKKGNLETMTWEAITNDETRKLQGMSAAITRAAARTLHRGVFNTNLLANPAMDYDSNALFHTSHGPSAAGNISSTALDDAQLLLAVKEMRNQTELDSGDVLALMPEKLFVGMDEAANANDLLTAVFDPTDPAQAATAGLRWVRSHNIEPVIIPNWVAAETGASTSPEDDWVLAADPSRTEIMRLAFLGGQRMPQVFVDYNENAGRRFMADEMNIKLRHIWEVQLTDHRGVFGGIV